MIRDKLFDFQNKNKCTYLGIGPMSQNCVDVTIDLANNYECPFFLIASRRQIDSEQFGGGYVNNWTTEKFAKYVLEKSKKGNIYLCRDHGGPWHQCGYRGPVSDDGRTLTRSPHSHPECRSLRPGSHQL